MNHERIMLIYEYLVKNTNAERSATIADIQKSLANNFNHKHVSALTIRRDIDRLTAMGYQISKTAGAHNTAFYSLTDKGFTFNEIRFIVDSISINKFLSHEQKKQLIRKFESMCSDSELRQLISRISLNGRAAPSLNLLNNLDVVHQLISEKRKIHFDYGHFDEKGNMVYYQKKREMIPVKAIYFNERFYLQCINEKTMQPRVYRIDRMKNITGGEYSSVNCKLPKYEGFVSDMFPPDYFETVTLRVKNFLRDDMIEQLGNLAEIHPDSENADCCIVRFKAGINKRFFLWLLRYGENIQLLAPEKERALYMEELKKIVDMYTDMIP